MNESYENTQNSNVSPEHEELGWGAFGVDVYIKVFIIGLLWWYLFRDSLGSVVFRWVNDASWSHGFLIPLFSLYFINQRKSIIANLKTRPNYLGLLFLFCCIAFYLMTFVFFKFTYIKQLTTIATLGSIVLFLGGWRLVKHMWLPIAYLIFAVPLPVSYYRSLTIPMRHLASQIASVVLSLVPQLEATARGVVIEVIYKGVKMEPGLDVAEACSGMRLLMTFLALGVAMAYLHYRPVWHRVVLLAATIPIAIVCNVVRVTITGFIYILWDPKYAQGIYHDMLGFLMLPLAFGLYGFLAWFMSNLFVEETEKTEDVIIRRRS